MTHKLDILRELLKTNESRFASIKYRNQQGELSSYLIHLNVGLRNVYSRDVAVLSNVKTENEVAEQARQELLESLKKSLETNFHNPAYTKEGYYEHLSKSVVYHEDVLYIRAFVVKKTVIEAGVYKEVKSAEKTIAKNKLRKLLKSSKIREFKIDLTKIANLKINGNVIVLD